MRVKIICISLQQAIERRQHMTDLLNNIGFEWEFFDAYDGQNIKIINDKIFYNNAFTGYYHDASKFLLDQIEQFGRIHYKKIHDIPYTLDISAIIDQENAWIVKQEQFQFFININYFRHRTMILNEIGCALSHYNVIKMLQYDEDYDAYLVLEDDVYLIGDLNRIIKQAEWYDLIWNILFLNIPGYGGHPGFIEPNTQTTFSNDFNLHVFSHYSSACSYLVNKNWTLNEDYINLPFDVYLSRRIDLLQLRIKEPVFMVDYTKLSKDSTINVEIF